MPGVAVAVGLGLAVALRVAAVVGDGVGVSVGVSVGTGLGLGGVVEVPRGGCTLPLGLMEVETKAGTVGDGACETRSPKPQASMADKRATAPAPVKK